MKHRGFGVSGVVELCNESRFEGAIIVIKARAIPKDTEKPKDMSITSRICKLKKRLRVTYSVI